MLSYGGLGAEGGEEVGEKGSLGWHFGGFMEGYREVECGLDALEEPRELGCLSLGGRS